MTGLVILNLADSVWPLVALRNELVLDPRMDAAMKRCDNTAMGLGAVNNLLLLSLVVVVRVVVVGAP